MSWKTNWLVGDTGHDTMHNDLGTRLNRIVHVGDPGALDIATAIGLGGMVFVPDGTYTTTTPITLTSNLKLIFESRNAKLINNTSDIFVGGGSNIEISGGTITASAGHVFAPTSSFSRNHIHGCALTASHPQKSIFTMDNAATAFDYIGNVVERCDLTITSAHTVPAWKHLSSGNVNLNVWRDLLCNFSGNYVFWIENVMQQNFAYDNHFQNIIFEKTTGGSINLLSCNHAIIDNCHEYDMQAVGDATHDLIHLGTGGSTTRGCLNCVINSVGRRGGALATGVYDINLEWATHTKVDSCGATSDFAYRTVIGTNTSSTVWINDTEHGTT